MTTVFSETAASRTLLFLHQGGFGRITYSNMVLKIETDLFIKQDNKDMF